MSFFEKVPANRIRIDHTIRIYGSTLARVTGISQSTVFEGAWVLDIETDPTTVPDGYDVPTVFHVYPDVEFLNVREEWKVVPHNAIGIFVRVGDSVSIDGRISGVVSHADDSFITLFRDGHVEKIHPDTLIQVRNY